MSTPFLTRYRRPLLLAAGLVAAGALGLRFLGGNAPKPEVAVAGPRPVQVEAVRMAPAVSPRVLSGTVRPRVETDLGFRVAGKIESRAVQAGDRVVAGQVLATLDAADLRLQLESAQAERAAATSAAHQAELERNRIADLRTKGWSTEQQFDRVRTAFDEAKARKERAGRQVELATNALGYAALRAEQAGIVTQTMAEPGQVVPAGQPILRLAPDGPREIAVAIPESEVALAREGRAEATLWSQPGKSRPARLRELSPQADPSTRTFAARYEVAELGADTPLGLTATLELRPAAPADAARVPLSALVEAGNGPAVYVVNRQTNAVHRRAVTVVSYGAGEALLASGLAAGEWVVTLGVHLLREGMDVRPVPAARNE